VTQTRGPCSPKNKYFYTDSKGHRHPMFKAALSTRTKLWKEPKCPSTDEWIKKIHTHICTHSYKKECTLAICNDMDGARVYYTKQTKSVRKTNTNSLICGI